MKMNPDLERSEMGAEKRNSRRVEGTTTFSHTSIEGEFKNKMPRPKESGMPLEVEKLFKKRS
jgi:hypothetical protein